MSNASSPLDAALENLADITLAQAPSIWPLAWGWWVLILLGLFSVAVAFLLLLKRIRRLKMKRHSLRAISSIDAHESQALRKIHIVLRKAATHYFPSSDISGLQGKAWQDFLTAQARPNKKVTQDVMAKIAQLESSLYTKAATISVEDAKQAVTIWISYCLPPSTSTLVAADSLIDSGSRPPLAKSEGVQHV